MDPVLNVKAGLSHRQPRWIQQTTGWRRQSAKAIAIVMVFVLGYSAFLHLSHTEVNWIWRTTGQYEKDNGHTSARGSQYLLGVGKADITGLESRSLSLDLIQC